MNDLYPMHLRKWALYSEHCAFKVTHIHSLKRNVQY